MTLVEQVKNRIDTYLEFDSSILFQECDCLEIFGGAVRDSIADIMIHDVDILSLPKSTTNCVRILQGNGYQFMENLSNRNVQSMYSETHCVFEPWTFINNHLKIVQIIRPTTYFVTEIRGSNTEETLKNNFFALMKEVDMSCCGVSYNGVEIKENYPNAIFHCLHKYYRVNEKAKMYNDNRIVTRTRKLDDRGWKNVENLTKEEKINLDRLVKLEYILNDN